MVEYQRELPVDLVTAHDRMLRNRRKVYTVVYGMCLMLLHPLIDRPTGFTDVSSVTILGLALDSIDHSALLIFILPIFQSVL